MELRVLGQRDTAGRSIRDELRQALRWSDAHTAWFAVAWAKRSGLRLIEYDLRSFKTAGNRLRMLNGVDGHGGTIEGLELARALSTEARVYHDANTSPPRIFPPEAVHRRGIASSSSHRWVRQPDGWRSSHQLRTGSPTGLGSQRPGRRRCARAASNLVRRAVGTPEATQRLTKRSIDRLTADPDVTVIPETYGPPRAGARNAERKNKTPLFGKVHGLAPPKDSRTWIRPTRSTK